MRQNSNRFVFGSNVVLLIAIGCIASALIVVSQYSAKQTRNEALKITGVALSLRERTTRGHLWFEEAISGDTTINLDTQVYGLFDEASVLFRLNVRHSPNSIHRWAH